VTPELQGPQPQGRRVSKPLGDNAEPFAHLRTFFERTLSFLLSGDSRRLLLAWVDQIERHYLRRQGDESHRLSAVKLTRLLERFLAADAGGALDGLIGQYGRFWFGFWNTASLSELTAEHAALCRSFARGLAQEGRISEDASPTSVPFVWSDKPPALGSGAEWRRGVSAYRRALAALPRRLRALTKSGPTDALCQLGPQIGKGLTEVPGDVKRDCIGALADLHGWHSAFIRKVADHSFMLSKTEWKALARTLLPRSSEIVIEPSLVLAFRKDDGKGESHLLVPEVQCRFARLPIAANGHVFEGIPLEQLASQSSPRVVQLFEAMGANAGAPERETLRWLSGLIQRRRQATEHEIVAHTAGIRTLLCLESVGGRAGGLVSNSTKRSESERQSLVDTVRSMQEDLKALANIEFFSDQRGREHWTPAFGENRTVQGFRIKASTVNRELAPPESYRGVGPEPTELFAHLKAVGATAKQEEANPDLYHRIREARFWEEVRGRRVPDRFGTGLSKFVKANDLQHYVRVAGHEAEWEFWLTKFVELFNAAAGFAFLAITTSGEMASSPTIWAWSPTKVGTPIAWRRRIDLYRERDFEPPQRKLSRGLEKPPTILFQLAPQYANCEEDFRCEPLRSELALGLLRSERHVDVRQRIRQLLNDGGTGWADLNEFCQLIGGEPAPRPGEKGTTQGDFEVVGFRFDERAPEGSCSKVDEPTFRFADGQLPKEPNGARLRPKVWISAGPTPTLIKVLRGLEAKGILPSAADLERLGHGAYDPGRPVRFPILASLGLKCLNAIHDRAVHNPAAPLDPVLLQIATAMREIGAEVVPFPRPDHGYDWETIDREMRASAPGVARGDVFGDGAGRVPHPSQKAGQIARIDAFGMLADGRIVERPRWKESLGPLSEQLLLARKVVETLTRTSQYRHVCGKGPDRHERSTKELLALSPKCMGSDAAGMAESDEHLCRMLVDLDSISDVVDGEHEQAVKAVRDEVVAYLETRGVSLLPGTGAKLDHLVDARLFNVPARSAGGIEVILSRRAEVLGRRPFGSVVVGKGVTTVSPSDANWILIDSLYRALREDHARRATSAVDVVREFSEFFERRDEYLLRGEVDKLIRIIGCAEAMGEFRLDSPDPASIRKAIERLEERVRVALGLTRVVLLPHDKFVFGADTGYRPRLVRVQGWTSGQVVRIVNPCYVGSGTRVLGEVLVSE
jgi:hypothetical protein